MYCSGWWVCRNTCFLHYRRLLQLFFSLDLLIPYAFARLGPFSLNTRLQVYNCTMHSYNITMIHKVLQGLNLSHVIKDDSSLETGSAAVRTIMSSWLPLSTTILVSSRKCFVYVKSIDLSINPVRMEETLYYGSATLLVKGTCIFS